ncbi:MAG: hypothetical protein LBQ12_04295 [Deltaproteobacteria bacterium]|nr:hypothetical protein [Deltaproteobacteria bacterium]
MTYCGGDIIFHGTIERSQIRAACRGRERSLLSGRAYAPPRLTPSPPTASPASGFRLPGNALGARQRAGRGAATRQHGFSGGGTPGVRRGRPCARSGRGPAVAKHECRPATGDEISKVSGLSPDLAMAMKAEPIRATAPIP